MLTRCRNPKHEAYQRYAGRGIKVCERWLVFENFRDDVGQPPTAKHTLERSDNTKGYEPENVVWATRKAQANNRRSNRLLEYKGETMTLQAWADRVGIHHQTLSRRIAALVAWKAESQINKETDVPGFAEILITGGAQTLALSTTAALLNKFSATGGSNGVYDGLSVQPDSANNRLKVVAGTYFIDAWAELTADAEADITLRVRKNGTAAAGLVGTAPAQQVVKTFSPSLSPALIAQGTCAEQDLTVTGLLTTDKLLSVVKPTSQAGLGIAGCRIKAADTLSVNFANVPNVGGNITPTASQTYAVMVARHGKFLVRAFGILQVLGSDAPGTLSLFSDPSVGAAGGAPKILVPIDLTLESSTGTPTVTISAARLAMFQIG